MLTFSLSKPTNFKHRLCIITQYPYSLSSTDKPQTNPAADAFGQYSLHTLHTNTANIYQFQENPKKVCTLICTLESVFSLPTKRRSAANPLFTALSVAGAEGLEPSARGFGDRRSTN